MNYESILQQLKGHGYDVSMVTLGDDECIRVYVDIGAQRVSLIHRCLKSIVSMPTFFLENASAYPRLAHSYIDPCTDLCVLCINVPDSVSINYHCPDLVVFDSLKRHIDLLSHMLTDPHWNKLEIVREFQAGWSQLVDQEQSKFLCLSENYDNDEIDIFKPLKKSSRGLSSYYIGKATKDDGYKNFELLDGLIRDREKHKERGYILSIKNLEPAPLSSEGLHLWFVNCLSRMSKSEIDDFKKIAKWRSHEFWLILNAETISGRSWFGIKFNLKRKGAGKKTLPLSISELEYWSLSAFVVDVFNKDRLMPRSGANKNFLDKNILIVGCGSVGGEIADKLARGGVGKLTLVDEDILVLDNLYRHILPVFYVNYAKTLALSHRLRSSYPWLQVISYEKRIEYVKSKNALEEFDLIIIAIGSPTVERQFHDWLIENKVSTPVLNTWLEGYGIGGHAVLEIPSTKGCLKCAYVEPDTFARGLSSNLNFIDKNQNINLNYAGCGDAFIPYNYLSASNTANISVDLAFRYLHGRVTDSSRMSWKGDSTDALTNGLILTSRYYTFNNSCEVLPLRNPECDTCDER